ncbi:DUF6443 domain-containing protein [Chryseobacterium vrystaatense]|uniref:DUF6443 domain-containing protein n=1 Tax=Chryseobacterium vrystaatense TaxID=307480 RepID=UPI00068D6DB3|nr:DUF6443 domain-containing protein [Chryseobacterium vrystaatense]
MKNQLILNVGLILFFLNAVTLNAQTPTENYIQAKTYLDYDASGQPTKTAETVEYFDGLGRPKQVVNVKASPLGKDVVTHIEYDGFGRQTKEFLPIPQAGTQNGSIYGFPLGNASAIYGSEKIFSEKVLENSPLDRILSQKQVGNAWNDKPVAFGYDAVTTADAVKKFSTSTTWENGATKSIPSNNGIYLDGQLYKNTVTDEDGNKTIEFTNGRGKLILLRKVVSASENADTYYVYNEYDQLAFIVPPLLSKIHSWNQTDQDNLAYEYRYDGRNRPVEKKLPGKGWEYMVYDKADRLILTQDANMRLSGTWHMTKYDQFGRVAYTGTLKDSSSRSNLQNQIANLIIYDARDQTGIVRNGITLYYTNVYFSVDTLLSVNYYDTYPQGYAFNPPFPSAILGEPVLTGNVSDGKSTKGLPVMSFIKNIEDNSWTRNYTYYDTRGRVVGTYSINHLGGCTQTESKLDFAGIAQTVVTRHKRLASDPEKVITENFTYDHQNRLLKHYHKVDQLPQELLADNTYNEIGQLVNKKTGNTSGTPLQSVDYQYNIRGWLTKVNNPADLGDKLFGYALKYENPEHAVDAPAKYNGNISEFDWRTSTGNFLRRYAYKYDALNRLKEASYREPTATLPVNDGYSELLTYDLNGNIQTLKRFQALNNIPILIDDLKYKLYEGNRLKLVIDNSGNSSGYSGWGNMMSYDLNGNMTNHIDKGIKKIGYNYLNLPQTVLFGGKDKLQFVYRADGIKLKKAFTYVVPQTGMILTKNTDYLDGFQYEQEPGGMPPLLQFFPTAEGYYDFQKKRYIYHYQDHVGNIRLAYYRGSNNEAIIDRETNYYPFGMEYEGFQGVNTQLQSYTYGYNGKEKQKETGWNDYGARMYMADLGRWGVVDPLAETSRRWSTYTYAYNNPIRFIDPDGMQNYDVIMSGNLKDKAFEQLQAKAGNLDLQMNSKGKVTASIKNGATATAAELKLLEATVDSSVMVNLDATSANSIDNTPLFGGAFGGSEIDDNGIVQTNQIMNPNQAEIIENAIGRPKGGTVLHEILESYIAGKNNPGAPGFGIGGDLSEKPYLDAHNAANKLDPSHKNYTISQTTDSVDVIIGGTKFGTVTSYINVTKTTPLIKSNGEPHRRKTVTSVTKVPVATAKDVRIRN